MKHLLTPISCLAFAAMAQAQFITLTDPWGNNVTNGTMEHWCDANPVPAAVEVDIDCQLNTADPRVVNMKRYELSVPEEPTVNYYCWGECYAPTPSGTHPLWYAPGVNTLDPTHLFTGFHAYYQPMGVVGPACFRFVWFDDNNPLDSVWVDLCYQASPVGMEDHAAASFKFSAYPVPSNGGNVELRFDAPRAGEQVTVELSDALGQRIATQRIRTGQQRLLLEEGQLSPGLAFATLRVNGQVRATRRLVITAH